MRKILLLTLLLFSFSYFRSFAQYSVAIDSIVNSNCGPTTVYYSTIGGLGSDSIWANNPIQIMSQSPGLGSFQVLTSGSDTLYCKDSLGNMSSIIYNAVFNAPLAVSGYFTINNGHVLAAGGIPPYTIIWISNGVTNSIGPTSSSPISFFTNIGQNCYVITVMDAAGCSVSTNLCKINSFVTSTPSCSGGSSGSISITTMNGIAPLSYSLNSGPTSTIPAFTNVAAGTYTVTTIDASSISTTDIVVVGVYTPSIGIHSLSNPCLNNNAGSLKVIAPGMTSFVWNTSPVQNTDSAIGLNPGIYQVTASNGSCSATATYNLQQIDLQVTAARDSICIGDSTLLTIASNSISTFDTIPPIGYPTSGAAYINDEDIFNVTVGGFSNSSNCSSMGGPGSIFSLFNDYTHLQMPFYNLNAVIPFSISIGTCGGNFDHRTAIYIDYNRDSDFSDPGELVQVSSVLNGPAQFTGNFTIPLSAISGVTRMRIVNRETTSIPLPGGSFSWGETEDYHINIISAPPQNISWLPQFNNNSNSTTIVNPTATTVYTVVCNDPNICIDTATVTVNIMNALNNINSTTVHYNTDCPLGTNGSIAVVNTPINTSFSYAWNTGDSTSVINNLGVGDYNVVVYDNLGGCLKLHDSIISAGINCGDINGSVVWDSSKNCIAAINEPGIANTKITVNPGNHITYTDASGNYAINGLPYNTYTVTKSNNVSGFVASSCGPTSVTGSLSNALPTFNHIFLDSSNLFVNYNVYAWGGCIAPALQANIPAAIKRKIFYSHNKPGLSQTATLYAVFDSIQLFASSVPAPTAINGDTITWNVTITDPSQFIDITFNFPPAQQLGFSFDVDFGIMNIVSQDTIFYDNHITRTFDICTSYDPNDKNVAPAGKLAAGYIPIDSNRSAYTVRFQNTGNYTAGKVIIMDTLSTLLDINDFQIEGASHNYELEVINNHILKIKFMNIMLPDSASDPDGSQGFVSFTIKHKNTAVGNVLSNKAAIYFDYNPPIITNTVVNTFYGPMNNNASASSGNTMCNSSIGNGSVTVSANGGVPPYTHTILPASQNTLITGNLISNLAGGSYTVFSTDAIGNVQTALVSVANTGSGVSGNTSITQINGTTLGSASFTGTGGIAPYTYLWTPGNMTNSTVTNLGAGSYTCVATDANGCTTSAVFNILTPLSIDKNNLENTISIYPNPAQSILHIESTYGFDNTIITNILGHTMQEIAASSAKQISIDISNWANGVYQIRMANGVVKKFVVRR